MPLVTALEARDEIPKLEFVISMIQDFERKRQSEIQCTTGSDLALFGMKGKSLTLGHKAPT